MLTVKLTPKQLVVLKKLLPTVKLNAYDIQIYQEIQQALENAFEEKNVQGYKKPKKKSYNNSQFINAMKNTPKQKPTKQYSEDNREKINFETPKKSEEPKQEVVEEQPIKQPEPPKQEIIEEEEEVDDEIEEEEEVDDEIEEEEEVDDEIEDIVEDEEPESIFTVIDRRKGGGA